MPNVEPGKIVAGEWRILDRLGEGAEGAVYRARHKDGGIDVALKVSGWDNATSIGRKGDRLARWHHPNLLRVITHGVHEEQGLKLVFLITELLTGGSLSERLDGTPVDLAQVRAWMLELLSAVAFLHDRDAFHRDIKPANILLDDVGSVRLADPGLVFFRDADGGHDAHHRRQQPGTPMYQSPEARNGIEGPGPQSDLWSCCCLLHELATGIVPALSGPLCFDDADLPDQLVDVIRTGLHADRARRYENANALASAIAAAIPRVEPAPKPDSEDHDWHAMVLDAIDLEIHAENRRSTNDKTSARCQIKGESHLDDGRLEWVTRLTVTDDIRIAEGDSCAVTSRGETTRCRAIDITGDLYTIASATRIAAEDQSEAELAETTVNLLQEFRQAVVNARTADWHDSDMAARVFTEPEATATEVWAPSPTEALPGRAPNSDQQDAIDYALVAPVSYLWGPPGTGKTEVIARIVHLAARAGERTLIVSATNVAVDTALERVLLMARDVYGAPPEPGVYARAGTIRFDGVLRSWRHVVDAESIALDSAPALRKEIRDARARLRESPTSEVAQQEFTEATDKVRKAAAAIERNAIAVGTTIHQCFLSPERFAGFDLVIIDEASMTQSTMVWFAAGLASKRVVISGDFRQLPPVIAANEQFAEQQSMRMLDDPFVVSGIAARVRGGRWPACLHALTHQYRMQEQIADLVSTIAYRDNPLKTESSLRRLGERVFNQDHDVVFIDTSSLHPAAGSSPGSRSAFNAVHGVVTMDLLACLAESRYLAPADCGVEVLTPYAAQSRLLRDGLKVLMRSHGLAPGKVRVSTVHRFQGQQRSTVVVELTPSEPWEGLGRLLGDPTGTRLLTVSASRAQDTLIIVGNLRWLSKYRTQYSGLDRLLQTIKAHDLAIDASILLADRRFGGHHVEVLDSAGYRSRYSGLAELAEHSLVVCSKSGTHAGLNRGLGVLKAAARRGVRVRVCIGDVARGGAEEQRLVALAAQSGIAVDVRSIPVESMTIVDGRHLLIGGFAPLGGWPLAGGASACYVDNKGLAHRLIRLVSLPRRGSSDGTQAENKPCKACGSPMRLAAIRDGGVVWSCLNCSKSCEEAITELVAGTQ